MSRWHTGKRMMLVLVVILCLVAGLALAEGAKLTLDQQQAVVFKGKKLQLTAQVSGTEEKVKYTWESSDPGIADVKNGNVTGKGAGEAVILCRTQLADGTALEASCTVSVQIPVSGIKAKKNKVTALVGIPSEPAEITVQPADASNPGVTWESADESVATVNQEGAITGVQPGKTTVTASAADGSGKSCKLTVTVYQQIQAVKLDQPELALEKKAAAVLQAVPVPEDSSDVKYSWSSSDQKVVKVSNGKITAASVGETDITVTAKSGDGTEVSAVCHVIVYVPAEKITAEEAELKLFTGDARKAGVKVEPGDFTGTILWTSDDSAIVEVDEEGTVTAVAPGETVLTATVTNPYSEAVKVSIPVTVRDGIPARRVPFAAGNKFAIGIREDGTVLVKGDNEDKILNAQNWDHIISVSGGLYHAAGLKDDGTVVSAGGNSDKQCNVDAWKDIAQVSAGSQHTAALGKDGTVYAVGSNKEGQLEVNGWKNIVQIAAGSWHTVGLRADGTVVAAGYNEYGQCNVSGWSDIVAIDAGHWTTVGLKRDGSVVFAGGWNSDEKKNMKEAAGWRGIRSISFFGDGPIAGITMDGKCVMTGGWETVSDPEHEIVQAEFDDYTNTLYCLLDNGTIIVKRPNKYVDTEGWKLQIPEVPAGDTLSRSEITMDYLLTGNYRQTDAVIRGKRYIAAGVLNDDAIVWYTGKANEPGFEMFLYNPDKGVLNYAFFDEAGDYYNYLYSDEMYLVLEAKNEEYEKSYTPAESPVGWVEMTLKNGVLTLEETDPADPDREVSGRFRRAEDVSAFRGGGLARFTWSSGESFVRSDGYVFPQFWTYVTYMSEETHAAIVAVGEKERSYLLRNAKYGFIDEEGNYILEPSLDYINLPVSEGIYQVSDGTYTPTYYDINARRFIKIPKANAGSHLCSHGLIAVFQGEIILPENEYSHFPKAGEGKWGFADLNGDIVIPCEWDKVGLTWSDEGLNYVVRNGRYGYIDETGKEIIPCEWDSATEFVRGVAAVQREGITYLIAADGTLVKEIGAVSFFSADSDSGMIDIGVEDENGKSRYGVLSPEGDTIVQCVWPDTITLSERLIGIKNEAGLWGILDMETGEQVVRFRYEDVRKGGDTFIQVKENGLYGYLNMNDFTEAIPCQYQKVNKFVDGRAAVQDGNIWIIIDTGGERVF